MSSNPLHRLPTEHLVESVAALPWAMLVGASALLVIVATLLVRRWLVRFGRRHTARLAQAGELRAARLLERSGYQVLAAQAPCTWPVHYGTRQVQLRLRVDYLVKRAGQLYVADAKTGRWPTSIRSAATRRQLLEYLIAYRAHGALLIDMHRERVVEVHFPELDDA